MPEVEYSASMSGERPKFVTCEKCGHEYGYWLERSGSGSYTTFMGIGIGGYGEYHAADKARSDLASKLGRDVDIVPCPECGRIQKKMVEKARDERFAWVNTLGWVSIPLGFMAFGTLRMLFITTLGGPLGLQKPGPMRMLVTIGSVMFTIPFLMGPVWASMIKDRIKKKYNPNKEIPKSERIREGRELAMSKAEHARLTGKACETKLHKGARLEDEF